MHFEDIYKWNQPSSARASAAHPMPPQSATSYMGGLTLFAPKQEYQLQKEQQFWFQEKKGETHSVQGFIEFM